MARDIYGFGWHQNSAMKYGCAKSVRVSRRFEYNPEWFHSINIVRKTLLIHASNVRNKVHMRHSQQKKIFSDEIIINGTIYGKNLLLKWKKFK